MLRALTMNILKIVKNTISVAMENLSFKLVALAYTGAPKPKCMTGTTMSDVTRIMLLRSG